MKHIHQITGVTMIAFVLSGLPASAAMMRSYGWNTSDVQASTQEVSALVGSILNAQNATSLKQLDCQKTTEDQFETLGDAYMGQIIGDDDQHELMDKMMGGEGSDSLRVAHINMGKSYLGCWGSAQTEPVYMPMMGGWGSTVYQNRYAPFALTSMMGGGYPVMGWHSYGGFSLITMGLVWTVLILGIIALIRWMRKK